MHDRENFVSPGSLVSVVTPFYNTREFLAECIESVLAQTWDNFEYILVDNQSDDGSSEIAERYARQNPERIRLTRTSAFLSQVQNYNFALSCISLGSMYCKMVQADDWIYPECIARMVDVAESDPSIGIVSSYRLKGKRVQGDGLELDRILFSGAEICQRHLTSSLFVFGTPTTLLYRSEIVKAANPFYDQGSLHEDTEACYRILRSWNLGFVHQVLSFSRVDNDSIMTRARDFRPVYLDRLLQLYKYGPVYLEKDQMSRELAAWEDEYYRFLARRLLSFAGKEFWNYQTNGLKSEGQRLKTGKLLSHVALELLRIAANPGASIARLWKKLSAA